MLPETLQGGGQTGRRLRVAVTGGSGQLGTLILRRLIDDRSIGAIVSIDLKPPALLSGKLQAVVADICSADLQRYFAQCDALIHLAFIVSAYVPRQQFDAVNIGGSRNVLQAAAAAGIPHILYASSMAAYGLLPGHPVPITEDSPRYLQDDFPYCAAKYRVEAMLDDLQRAHPQLVITRFRPVMMLGGRMRNPMDRLLRRRIMPNAGETWLALVWDEDVADAFMTALKRRIGGAFNLAAGEPMPARHLAASTGMRVMNLPRPLAISLARLSPFTARLGLFPSTDPAWIKYGTVKIVTSTQKARAELGWTPRFATAPQVLQQYLATASSRPDFAIVTFMRMVDLVGRFGPPLPDLRGVRTAIHLRLTGRGGGDFGLRIADGRLLVTSGAPTPPDAVITLAADRFRMLLAGRAEWGNEVLTGRVRADGLGHAPMVIAGVISSFRARLRGGRLQRYVTNMMVHWIAAGTKP